DGDGGPLAGVVVLWLDIAQRSYCREVRACGIFDLSRIPSLRDGAGAFGTGPAALKQATSTIPIVFNEPVAYPAFLRELGERPPKGSASRFRDPGAREAEVGAAIPAFAPEAGGGLIAEFHSCCRAGQSSRPGKRRGPRQRRGSSKHSTRP